MNDERPEALLRSALEKIVYFEARSEQLSGDLENSRAEAERLKAELGAAAQREIELRRQIAELEVQAARAHRDREELARMNDALRRERATLVGKLIEASRIHDTARSDEDGGDLGLDLASFISELRGEVLASRAEAQLQAKRDAEGARAQAPGSPRALSGAAAPSVPGFSRSVPASVTSTTFPSNTAGTGPSRLPVLSVTHATQARRTGSEAPLPVTTQTAPPELPGSPPPDDGHRAGAGAEERAALEVPEVTRTSTTSTTAPVQTSPSEPPDELRAPSPEPLSASASPASTPLGEVTAEQVAALLDDSEEQRPKPEVPAQTVAAEASRNAAPAPRPPPESSAMSTIERLARQLKSEGRLSVSEAQFETLSSASGFAGRTEETLFGFSVRELSAPDSAARIRAAERLKALGSSAAAPALASALHAEMEPQVQVVLLDVFSTLASSQGAAIVEPLLRSDLPEVRIAALKALIVLDPALAGPHLSAAMEDPDRAVRRRASLLALSLTGDAALRLGEEAIRDRAAEVRSVAALVLGASGGERAKDLLLGAMRDPDRKVRRAAAQSLSRLLGQDVSGVVEMDDAQRRREVRRISAMPTPASGMQAAALTSMENRAAAREAARRSLLSPKPASASVAASAPAVAQPQVKTVAAAAPAPQPVYAQAAAPSRPAPAASASMPSIAPAPAQPVYAVAAAVPTQLLVAAPSTAPVYASAGGASVQMAAAPSLQPVFAAAVAAPVYATAPGGAMQTAAPPSAPMVQAFAPGAPTQAAPPLPPVQRAPAAPAPSAAPAPVSATPPPPPAPSAPPVQMAARPSAAPTPAASHVPSRPTAQVPPPAPARSSPATSRGMDPADRTVSESLCATVLSEIRCAIRGRTVTELCVAANLSHPVAQEACDLLTARGQLVRRGTKYFVA